MKTLFIDAKSEIDVIPVVVKALKFLPKKVGLVTTIQHADKLQIVKEFLEKNKKSAVIGGQILGCNFTNAEKISGRVDCFLFIGSGKFHPTGAMLKTRKKIVCANPFSEEISVIDEKEIEKMEKRKKGAYMKFLSADNIGIIISTKPGQESFKNSEALKKKYKSKKFYLFVSDTINFSELENFPFIQCWVNTACPRIAEDYERINKPVVNLEDI